MLSHVAQQCDHIVMFFLLGLVIHHLVFPIQEPPLSVDWRMNGLDSNKEALGFAVFKHQLIELSTIDSSHGSIFLGPGT